MILVTGGAGFIGSNLQAALVRRGLETIIVDMRREKFGAKSEKLRPDQFHLPLEDVEIAQGVLDAAQEKAAALIKVEGADGIDLDVRLLTQNSAQTTLKSKRSLPHLRHGESNNSINHRFKEG